MRDGRRRSRPPVPVSRRLSAHRHSLLGHPVPARGFRLSSRSAYRRRGARTLTGFPRSARASTTGVGAPSTPRPAVFTRPAKTVRPPLAAPPAARPCTPVFIPSAGALGNEASAGVHSRSPVRSSPRLCSRMERERFGFFPELRTPQLPATHVRAGTGLEHWPGATSPTSSSALQSTSSLATCDLVSHVLGPVIADEQQPSSFRPCSRQSGSIGRTTSALMETVLTASAGHDTPSAVHPPRSPAGARSCVRTSRPGGTVLTCRLLP